MSSTTQEKTEHSTSNSATQPETKDEIKKSPDAVDVAVLEKQTDGGHDTNNDKTHNTCADNKGDSCGHSEHNQTSTSDKGTQVDHHEKIAGQENTAPASSKETHTEFDEQTHKSHSNGNDPVSDKNSSGKHNISSNVNPHEQSQMAKEANLKHAADKIGVKMANEPGSVTAEDAALLQSREERAHGHVEKGGITSEAQKLASENEKTREGSA